MFNLSSANIFNLVLSKMLLFEKGLNKPITRRQILNSSKLKDFAEDNLKFEENGRMIFKLVENTVGKGEIARYE